MTKVLNSREEFLKPVDITNILYTLEKKKIF